MQYTDDIIKAIVFNLCGKGINDEKYPSKISKHIQIDQHPL